MLRFVRLSKSKILGKQIKSGACLSRTFSTSRPDTQVADSMTDIGTRRIFDSDADMFRETVRKFYKDKVVPFHDQWIKDGQVSRELWQDAGKNGLLGVTMPEKFGGADADTRYAAIGWEEQMYANTSGPGFALHSEIVMPYLLHYGSEQQQNEFLPPMISGDKITAIAMTEPGAGSDLQGMKTNAVADGDDFILNGSKTFITNGYMCDMVIVCAVTNPEVPASRGISLFLVEEGMKGFKKGKKLSKIGLHAQDTAELFFEDVRVPKTHLLGKLNGGFPMLMQELPQERLLIADMSVASAEACFELTRAYVKERKAFGKPLLANQTVAHSLAHMKTEIVVARHFVDRCIELLAEKKLDAATACMAKVWGSDMSMRIADQCVQLHGGWGYMDEMPVSRFYNDSRVTRIYGGANEVLTDLISRSL